MRVFLNEGGKKGLVSGTWGIHRAREKDRERTSTGDQESSFKARTVMIDGQIGEAELETAGLAVIPRRYHQKGFVFSTGV